MIGADREMIRWTMVGSAPVANRRCLILSWPSVRDGDLPVRSRGTCFFLRPIQPRGQQRGGGGGLAPTPPAWPHAVRRGFRARFLSSSRQAERTVRVEAQVAALGVGWGLQSPGRRRGPARRGCSCRFAWSIAMGTVVAGASSISGANLSPSCSIICTVSRALWAVASLGARRAMVMTPARAALASGSRKSQRPSSRAGISGCWPGWPSAPLATRGDSEPASRL